MRKADSMSLAGSEKFIWGSMGLHVLLKETSLWTGEVGKHTGNLTVDSHTTSFIFTSPFCCIFAIFHPHHWRKADWLDFKSNALKPKTYLWR